MPDHAEIVADEQVRQAHLGAQAHEQVENLRLNRDIEGGDRFVADQELRRHRECTGNPDALSLSARELVRVTALQRRIETDPEHHLVEPVVELVPAPDPVNSRRFTDDLAHALARAQGCIGILEDHLHLERVIVTFAPAHLRHRALTKFDGSARRLVNPGDHAAQGRFAAAGFADQTDDLAGLDRQIDAVDGTHDFFAQVGAQPSCGTGDQIQWLDEMPGYTAHAQQCRGHPPLPGW